jgi:hypothetical protein
MPAGLVRLGGNLADGLFDATDSGDRLSGRGPYLAKVVCDLVGSNERSALPVASP